MRHAVPNTFAMAVGSRGLAPPPPRGSEESTEEGRLIGPMPEDKCNAVRKAKAFRITTLDILIDMLRMIWYLWILCL